MIVSYLTSDELNASLARRLARSCGVGLQLLGPKEIQYARFCDLVLCDLDALSPAECDALLGSCSPGSQQGRLVLHSYRLSDTQMAKYRKMGILAFRRLARPMFQMLKQIMDRSQSRLVGAW
jgi:hypothetical protein